MISSKNVANALGGKTARACDCCIKKRARWYCAADDAFLCQACDSSVHSANPLARRHERFRLKTASLKSLVLVSKDNSMPSWHKGFTRKARTPRHSKSVSRSKMDEALRIPIPLVPEVGSDENSHEENEEEQLLYRVPIFDPFLAELHTSTTVSNEAEATVANADQPVGDANVNESKESSVVGHHGQKVEGLHGFLSSDMDLAEFAADVESLLGKGLENESFGMEDLGLMNCKEEKELLMQKEFSFNGKVKLEEEEEAEAEAEAVKDHCQVDNTEIDMAREPPFELSFDYDSPGTCGEEDEKAGICKETELKNDGDVYEDDQSKTFAKKRKILLKLDYEAVITAWGSQGSPWTTGNQPDFDPECWPDCMGICAAELHHPYQDINGGGLMGHPMLADGGREARVSRYREKRRTRLFSKKIRYEVRKLNAEKRPRMKGRFVKRASFAGSSFPLLNK